MFTLVPLTFQSSTGEGSTFVTTIGRYQTFDSRPLPNPEGEISVQLSSIKRTLTWYAIYSGPALATIADRNDYNACGATLLHPGW
jgi:hypothetical protein